MELVDVGLLFLALAAGAVASWLIARRVRPVGHLDYEVADIRRLLPRTGFQRRGELEVLHDGDPVKAPYLILIRIQNTGRVGIGKEDFQGSPIRRAKYDGLRRNVYIALSNSSKPGSDPIATPPS